MTSGSGEPASVSIDATITVAIADDHPMVREALESLIEAEPDMRLVASARDGLEAVTRVLATRPRVVVLDLHMPGCDGEEATRRIMREFPEARIVILSGDEGDQVVDALKAGAVGYISKQSVTTHLVEGIRSAADGRALVSSALLARIVAALHRRASPLADRELEILNLVAEGMTNEQIARSMRSSVSTVKAQLAAVYDKVGAVDRASALAVCFRNGWMR